MDFFYVFISFLPIFHPLEILFLLLLLTMDNRYWMEFNKWEVFVNDELTRSFLSLEVTGEGLLEVYIRASYLHAYVS